MLIPIRNKKIQALGYKTYFNPVTENFSARKDSEDIVAHTEDRLEELVLKND